MPSRLRPWKVAALVASLGLAAAFVGWRAWSASRGSAPETRPGPVAEPAAKSEPVFLGGSKSEPVFLGGSKSLILAEPQDEKKAPPTGPPPPAQQPSR